ncbi:MAG TPA: serine hydrolase, partial [Actinomycetes bacterium]|nr:serine hydrolase [Actinomycetes bacterium]
MCADDLMAGFPPAPDSLVTLANWQDPPFNRWSFTHLREIIPTHRIARGQQPRTLPWHPNPPSLDEVGVTRLAAGRSTVEEVLADTWTDAVVVLHDGRVVLERYYGGMRPESPHLLMSVSKSIVGCVAGILADHGRLDTEAPVTDYVPEIKGSGYDGATVRNLLDMRTGVAFSEAYLDPEAEVRVMERHMGWRPDDEHSSHGMYRYLTTLGSDGPHGGGFVYRSADTDMLGWVCERAAGTRMAELISTLIWAPMGAEFDADITCDGVGSAIHDGGVSATARDLARFGQLLMDEGRVSGRPIVPEQWLRDSWRIDADTRHAFASSDSDSVLIGGWYRNQFWFTPGLSGDVLLCLGIHGQMVLVDRSTRTVAVKLSTWPRPQDVPYLVDTIRAFTAAGRHLAGLSPVDVSAAWPTGPSGLVEGR